MSNTHNQKSGFLVGFYLFIALTVLPAISLNEGLKYIKRNDTAIKVKLASQELGKFVGSFKLHANEENFWLNRLSTDFSIADHPQRFFASLSQLFDDYKVQAEMIIFDGQGNHYKDNFLHNLPDSLAWKNSGSLLLKVIGETNSDERFIAINSLRPIFGPNFYLRYYRSGNLSIPKTFYQTDFSRNDYHYWFARSNQIIAVIRFKSSELKKSTGIRYFAKNFHQDEKLAIFKNLSLKNTEIPETEAKFFFNELLQQSDREIVTNGSSVYTLCQITNQTWVLFKKEIKLSTVRPGRLTAAIFLALFFLFTVFRKSGIISQRFADLSIFGQIFVLMFISAGVPLVILAFVATGYFNSKRVGLIQEHNQQMIDFIQQINDNANTEMARYSRFFKQTIEEYSSLLKSDFSEKELDEFAHKLRKNSRVEGFLVKNDEFFYIRENRNEREQEVEEAKKILSQAEIKKRKENAKLARQTEQKNVKVIANNHLAYLNNTPPKPVSIETAYIMEMFFQKSIPMLIHDFIKIEGSISPTGWGNDMMMLFVQSLKLANPELFDSYLVLTFTAETFELYYIRNQIHQILRNPYEYKAYIILEDRMIMNNRKSLLDFPEIQELALKSTDYPLSEPIIQNYQGKPHIFVGLRGNKVKTMKFCVLYPLAKIEKIINQEAVDLAYLAILAMAIVFSMILTLYLNLLLPIRRLHQAAHALEIRDAKFRLPEDRNDEFGEMAKIFNASIAEFEELQVAGIVQSRLLPGESLSMAKYSVYGRTIPMASLGGDYFDYFRIDDNNFAALLGDVAGHGVGASLIMAIAKAGVLSAKDVWRDPAGMLARLHQIILATKSKLQRKVMTFQYLLIDQIENQVIYANAGGCSPVFIDPENNDPVVINHSGAVLGGFKKNVFNNLNLPIKPGQAMILYTDGMVESRNESGNELGYKGLHGIFKDSYDLNAEKFYDNIYRNYLSWLGNAEPGDDLTVLVIVCNKELS